MNQSGILHRHADGREHRHFSAGFTIGGQVIEDHDGTEEHSHGILGSEDGKSGPVVWIAEYETVFTGTGEHSLRSDYVDELYKQRGYVASTDEEVSE